MVDADLDRWQKWLKGEGFPWDAFNYPGEDKILSRYQKKDK
jgi:GDPmannose 4,6-dehydratase